MTSLRIARLVGFAGQLGMVSYSASLDPFLPAIFPPERVDLPLGEVVAKAGLTQLRIACLLYTSPSPRD